MDYYNLIELLIQNGADEAIAPEPKQQGPTGRPQRVLAKANIRARFERIRRLSQEIGGSQGCKS
jgi:hypothetical protein